MDELNFKIWLTSKGINKKVSRDVVSRLKRIEREIKNCDIDEEYRKDKCNHLISIFLNNGKNEEMKKYLYTNFPVGKYHISTFRYALNKYVQFCDELYNNSSSNCFKSE